MALVVRARRGRKRAAKETTAVTLPAFWEAVPGLLLAAEEGAVRIDGIMLLVFMTKGLLVSSGHNGPRDWKKRMRSGFGPGPGEDLRDGSRAASRLRRQRCRPG